MDPVTGALISGGIKLLGGLFGGGKKSPTPAQNMLSQAQGAREASDKYGFNPLTMLQYGQPGGAMGGGGAPPLASAELLTGALLDVADAASGEASRRAASNQLEQDLGQLKLDQLRSGVLAVAPSATATVGDGLPVLGRRAATVVPQGPGPALTFSTDKTVPVPLKPVPTQYVTSSGETLTAGVGPEADELLSGAALEAAGGVKSRLRSRLDVDNFSFGSGFDILGSALPYIYPPLRAMPTRQARDGAAKHAAETRAASVDQYKRDKAAGKIPPLTYIKPF